MNGSRSWSLLHTSAQKKALCQFPFLPIGGWVPFPQSRGMEAAKPACLCLNHSLSSYISFLPPVWLSGLIRLLKHVAFVQPRGRWGPDLTSGSTHKLSLKGRDEFPTATSTLSPPLLPGTLFILTPAEFPRETQHKAFAR